MQNDIERETKYAVGRDKRSQIKRENEKTEIKTHMKNAKSTGNEAHIFRKTKCIQESEHWAFAK